MWYPATLIIISSQESFVCWQLLVYDVFCYTQHVNILLAQVIHVHVYVNWFGENFYHTNDMQGMDVGWAWAGAALMYSFLQIVLMTELITLWSLFQSTHIVFLNTSERWTCMFLMITYNLCSCYGLVCFPILYIYCSQTLSTLSYIECVLAKRRIPIPYTTTTDGSLEYSDFQWIKNKNYFSKLLLIMF